MPFPPFHRHALARLAFADHIDRLVANKSPPGPKGKALEEIRGETIALTPALLLGSAAVPQANSVRDL